MVMFFYRGRQTVGNLKLLTKISVNLPRFDTLELMHRDAHTLSILYAEYKSSKKVS